MISKQRLLSSLAALALLTFASTSMAQNKDYLIEVVIFEALAGEDLSAGGLYFPRIENSLRLGSEEAVAQGFLPVEQNLQLTENAADIAGSSRYRLLRHLAWRQPGLGDDEAKAVRIALGGAVPLFLPEDLRAFPEFYPASANPTPDRSQSINTTVVNGSITVRLGRFLHMDARLAYTDELSGQTFRLAQSRKMRSGELHYIDNPRFGILTKITPLEDKAGVANVDDPTDGAIAAPE